MEVIEDLRVCIHGYCRAPHDFLPDESRFHRSLQVYVEIAQGNESRLGEFTNLIPATVPLTVIETDQNRRSLYQVSDLVSAGRTIREQRFLISRA